MKVKEENRFSMIGKYINYERAKKDPAREISTNSQTNQLPILYVGLDFVVLDSHGKGFLKLW